MRVLPVFACIILCVWGVFLVTTIPLEYRESVTEVASYYLETSLEDTGSKNVVAAILADYRLFDTIGEATVLFVAILGVTLILGRNHHKTEQKIKHVDQLYRGGP